ncbi:hypothetical protein TELCIR_09508, partial [Teladorsagia circumcincta]
MWGCRRNVKNLVDETKDTSTEGCSVLLKDVTKKYSSRGARKIAVKDVTMGFRKVAAMLSDIEKRCGAVEFPIKTYSINDSTLEESLLDPTSVITQLYNPAGPGPVCVIRNSSLTWMDANKPNTSSETLHRIIRQDDFDCRHQIRNLTCVIELGNFLLPRSRDSSAGQCTCDESDYIEDCENFPPLTLPRVSFNGALPYDVSGFDLSAWSINYAMTASFGYGGLALGYQNPNVPFDYGVGKRRSLRKLAVRHVSKILFDTRAFHSQPVHLNLWHNSLLRAAINRSGKHVNPGAYAIRLTNHPLPTGMVTFNVKRILQNNDILIALFITIALIFVPCSFIFLIVSERSSSSLHLQ